MKNYIKFLEKHNEGIALLTSELVNHFGIDTGNDEDMRELDDLVENFFIDYILPLEKGEK